MIIPMRLCACLSDFFASGPLLPRCPSTTYRLGGLFGALTNLANHWSELVFRVRSVSLHTADSVPVLTRDWHGRIWPETFSSPSSGRQAVGGRLRRSTLQS